MWKHVGTQTHASQCVAGRTSVRPDKPELVAMDDHLESLRAVVFYFRVRSYSHCVYVSVSVRVDGVKPCKLLTHVAHCKTHSSRLVGGPSPFADQARGEVASFH